MPSQRGMPLAARKAELESLPWLKVRNLAYQDHKRPDTNQPLMTYQQSINIPRDQLLREVLKHEVAVGLITDDGTLDAAPNPAPIPAAQPSAPHFVESAQGTPMNFPGPMPTPVAPQQNGAPVPQQMMAPPGYPPQPQAMPQAQMAPPQAYGAPPQDAAPQAQPEPAAPAGRKRRTAGTAAAPPPPAPPAAAAPPQPPPGFMAPPVGGFVTQPLPPGPQSAPSMPMVPGVPVQHQFTLPPFRRQPRRCLRRLLRSPSPRRWLRRPLRWI
jgi:hypothetical protein